MKTFDVYPLFDIRPVRAKGAYIWDEKGDRYLDFYGGHAVISVGHSHPHYISALHEQLQNIGFYSNSVMIPQQEALAGKLGKLSGYDDYNLFLCNSGAEANENAMKLASFQTGRKKIIAFTGAFHGRTSLAVAATHDPSIVAPVNHSDNITFLAFGDNNAISEIDTDVAAVIIEGIQGVGGIQESSADFLRQLSEHCKKAGAMLILDEIQSGYGRSGKFFAHQHAHIKPDLITVAKGMGNGFPVAGVLISPAIKAKHGMLGTTFGGNHLACAASIAVLDIIEKEKLIENSFQLGNYLTDALSRMEGVTAVRGKGLMIGIDVAPNASEVRRQLLDDHKIFTGYSSATKTIRLLPPMNVSKTEANEFIAALEKVVLTHKIRA